MHRADVVDLDKIPTVIDTQDHPLHNFRLTYLPYFNTTISNDHVKEKAKEDILCFLKEKIPKVKTI